MVRYVGIRRLYPVNGANFALQTKDAYVQTVFLEVAQAAASRHDVGDGGQEFRISHLRRRSDSGDYRVDTQNPCRIRRPRHIFLPRQERGAASGPLPGDSGCGHKVGNHSYSHIKGWGNGDRAVRCGCGPCQTSWWSPTSSGLRTGVSAAGRRKCFRSVTVW